MFNYIKNYLQLSSRQKRKTYRTIIRPFKDYFYFKRLLLIRQLLSIKNNFFQIKNLRFLGIFFILFWLFRDFAMAVEPTKQSSGSDMLNGTIDLLNGVLDIITLVVHPIVMFIGWLLSPDWTMGDIIGLRPVIHKVWTLMSNIVYIIFAFILIAMAFMNIFGDSKSFALKATLPKLIGGILLVPFTWFIVSAGLSVSNILTASVVGLAKDSINTYKPGLLDTIKIPKDIHIDLTTDNDWEGGKDEHDKAKAGDYKNVDCSTEGDKCVSLKDIMENQNGAFNLLGFYAYGIFKIDKLKEMSPKETDKSIKKVLDIFKKLTFGALFSLIFGILVIALFFALLSRSVMLWLYAMFSPLFALTFFLKDKGGKIGKELENMTITKFISLAMVPVYVSAALSFGLVFLSMAMNSDFIKDSKTIGIEKVDEDGNQTINFGGKEKGVNLIIVGNYNQGDNGIFGGGILDTSKGMISNIIISFIALAILWMAVMAALNANDITKNAVKPFDDMGKSVGGLLKDMPKYAPIPMPGGKSMSVAGLSSATGSFKNAIETAATSSGSTMGSKFGQEFAKNMGMTVDESLDKLKNYNKDHKSNGTASGDADLFMGAAKIYGKKMDELTNNPIGRQELATTIMKMGSIDDATKKKLADGLVNASSSDKLKIAFDNIDTAIGKGGNIGLAGIDLGTNWDSIVAGSSKATKEDLEKPSTPKIVDYSGPKIEKTTNSPLEVKIKIDGTEKNIKLENSTIISKSNIAIDTNDKGELKGLLTGDKTKDENLFKKIFGDEIGKKVYDEIIK